MSLEVEIIPVFDDNYIFLVHDNESKNTAVVDPALSQPVLDRLKEKNWNLTHIFNTHHHPDHVGGNLELVAATKCEIIGSEVDQKRIPGIVKKVNEGDTFNFGNHEVKVFETFGHTLGHISYWIADEKIAFVGDTMFALGCGRLFEGTPAQMWKSLCKLGELPKETKIYCAHEYTEANLKFALTIEPDNTALIERSKEIKDLRANNIPTIPTTVGQELETSPFLRANIESVQKNLNMVGSNAVDVFAEIRSRKDNF